MKTTNDVLEKLLARTAHSSWFGKFYKGAVR